jgi:hypothetical protein
MIEVISGITVGSEKDFRRDLSPDQKSNWQILFAAKHPWHKNFVGYEGNAAPKDSKEYLWADREDGRILALNMIDAPQSKFFQDPMIDRATAFIGAAQMDLKPLFIACNKGKSRGPGLVMLYLGARGMLSSNFDEAEKGFKTIYPMLELGSGFREYLKNKWDSFAK